MRRLALVPAVFLCLAALIPTVGARASSGVPGLNACPLYGDTQICSGEVPSYDGTLLDVDLTLPMTSGSRHSLMIMAHGFGNNKHEWESVNDEADNARYWHWNSHWFAEHGYYVLTYTARGFNDAGRDQPYEPNTPGGSSAIPNGVPPADTATIHIKSKEFEITDTQYLAALVAAAYPDLDRNAVAITGGSYGGGESWLQASLASSSITADGGTAWSAFPGLPALQLQVAIPKYPWTDLAYSLAPNGHGGGPAFNDIYASSQGSPATTEADENPFGVAKQSYVLGLYALGTATGRFEHAEYVPTRSQEEAEDGPISTDAWLLRASEDPYPTDPVIRQIRRGLTIYRAAYYQPNGWTAQVASHHEVAIMSFSGWTDYLFEPIESFRAFKYLKSLDPQWPVSVAVADIGHMIAQNKPDTWHRLNVRAWGFLESNINGAHERQSHVYSEPTICANDTDTDQNLAAAQQIEGRTPEGLSNGTMTINYAGTDSFTEASGAGDPDGLATDPITPELVPGSAAPPPCRVSQAATFAGRYSGVSDPVDRHVLYVGLGEVQVNYVQTGVTAELDARVWDVAPNRTAILVTRGTYRIDPTRGDLGGTLRLPLFGNQWNVELGHRIRVDLTEVDTPYFVPGKTPNTLTISDVRLLLPTREANTLSFNGSQTSA
ncbi:MAG TPA: hypothetical protein VIT43_16090 [Candidatus Dormibacteraeota bacterium]